MSSWGEKTGGMDTQAKSWGMKQTKPNKKPWRDVFSGNSDESDAAVAKGSTAACSPPEDSGKASVSSWRSQGRMWK